MKAVWCIIWILGASLIIATLDNSPDPPAAGPSATQLKASLPCETAGNAIRFSESLGAFFRSTLRFAGADTHEPPLLNSRMVLTVHAADPSPPAQLSSHFAV